MARQNIEVQPRTSKFYNGGYDLMESSLKRIIATHKQQ